MTRERSSSHLGSSAVGENMLLKMWLEQPVSEDGSWTCVRKPNYQARDRQRFLRVQKALRKQMDKLLFIKINASHPNGQPKEFTKRIISLSWTQYPMRRN